MKKFFLKNYFRLIGGGIIVATLITVILIILLPINYKPVNTVEEIRIEMVNRIENISKRRDLLNMVSITPFMWDEGYYLDSTFDENSIKDFTDRNISHQELAEDEQRLIFYYKNQFITDLIINKDEIYFEMPFGRINKDNSWLNIERNDEIIRIFS